jgi:hypothetical protein
MIQTLRTVLAALLFVFCATALSGEAPGIVSNIKVLSDKVEDMSNLETWKRHFIKDGMTDEQKALAIWRTVASFQHQDNPPLEWLQQENTVQDPIKVFNVYGYGFCSMASCEVAAMARYVGLQARGRIINSHSVSEVFFDDAWHLLDGSLICYFPKADGKIASVDELIAGVKEWYANNPGYHKDDKKLRAFMKGGGWRKGPDILTRTKAYNENGWLPAATHGWYATMSEYDGSHSGMYEYGYSQGYQVNIQLRKGERLTRNWSNKGLTVSGAPGCIKAKVGDSMLRHTPALGDIAVGRVGNGTHEYNLPLADGSYKTGALVVENLEHRGAKKDGPAVFVKDGAAPGVLIVRMRSNYVYLTGTLNLDAHLADGGTITVSVSDNNGMDWKEVAKAASGTQTIDLKPFVHARYDYRVKFELKGSGTGLNAAGIVHDIQHSQRVLPGFTEGKNSVTFSAGPQEGTITVEGNTAVDVKGKQLLATDFHPEMNNTKLPYFGMTSGKGDVTFPIKTPGDITRIRFGAHYRARDAKDGWDLQVSVDGGKTFKTVDRAAGPFSGHCKYATFSDVPAGTREALVRYAGNQVNVACIFNFRIDADYKEPNGGFHPVKITYTWDENGAEKQDVHVAAKPEETYTIDCAVKPTMKSIVLELAE